MKNKNSVTRVEEKVEALLKTESSRRKFLSVTGKTLAVVSALPLLKIAGKKHTPRRLQLQSRKQQSSSAAETIFY